MGSLGTNSNAPLSFHIQRTKNKTFPVYTDFKNGRQIVQTILRKYTGNVQDLKMELQYLLGPETKITEKVGRIEIQGKHTIALKKWLEDMGF